MSDKTARGPIKIRKEHEGYFVEHGYDEEGPLIAVQVAPVVLDLLKRNPQSVVLGPTHSLGPHQNADAYSAAPYAVLNRRGDPVDTGYSPESLLNKNIGRLLGWKRGSEEGVSMSRRQRRTWGAKEAARAPSGLYGYTKKTQTDCEAAVRKINRRATALIRSAYRKDERILGFLETHSKRTSSNPARVLLSAWKGLGKSASEIEGGKVAAGRSYSLYGYPSKTVKMGLALCSQLREEAGTVAADLHARRVARHERITGFFKEHSKKTRCYSSRMLLAGYPDPDARYATEMNKKANLDGVGEGMVGDWFTRGSCGDDKMGCGCDGNCAGDDKCSGDCGCGGKSATPQTVDDWLSWDMDELEGS